MASRKNSPDGEWSKLIKAQDDLSKQVLTEEQELQRLSKIRYKEELDKQLKYKRQILQGQVQDKTQESSFQKAQRKAMKEFENKRKKQDREHHFIIQSKNQEDIDLKNRIFYQKLEQEKKFDESVNKKAQQEIESEKQREKSLKNKRIQEEQEEIRRINLEKSLKSYQAGKEKLQDKKMIENRVKEMRDLESGYREFYDKKLQDLEQKMKFFQPVVSSDNSRQELIQKRTEEWEKIMKEKSEIQARKDQEDRKKNTSFLKNSLETQIEEKQKIKKIEALENKYFQTLANSKAVEEENRRLEERGRRLKEQEQLKKAYEDQLREKDKIVIMNLSMNNNEKRIHNEVFNNINQKKIVAFPGVPGSHLAESPIKRVFKKVYGTTDRSTDSLHRVKMAHTPPPFEDSQKKYNFPDPYKHDPITNPIGAELPRVLPGERMVRVPWSHSKLAIAGNNLFK